MGLAAAAFRALGIQLGAKGERADPVGELGPVVSEPDGAGRTLHVEGSDMLRIHSLGGLP